jgi:hypothetical protein
MKSKTVTIEFGSERAAEHFAKWLDGQGERSYWIWMGSREQEEGGEITAKSFDYFQGGNEFAPNGVIKTTLGRLTGDDNGSVLEHIERSYYCEFVCSNIGGTYVALFSSPALAAEVQVVLEKAGYDTVLKNDGCAVAINSREPDRLP